MPFHHLGVELFKLLPSFPTYKFHDTPDDEDVFLKALYMGKYATKVGVAFAVYDVVLTRENRTKMEKLLKFPKYVVPLVGMTTAFTLTMHLATKALPSWDHKFHYMLGGISAAGIMGHFAKSGVVALNLSVFLGGIAFAYQYAREQRELCTEYAQLFYFQDPGDWKEQNEEKRRNSNWITHDLDFRLYKNKQRSRAIDYVDSF